MSPPEHVQRVFALHCVVTTAHPLQTHSPIGKHARDTELSVKRTGHAAQTEEVIVHHPRGGRHNQHIDQR